MKTKLLIIGAGPYGLALAAFAKKHAIDFIILGEPMGFWKNNMPADMLLRSGIDWHLDPFDDFTFHNFLLDRGIFDSFELPITKKLFLDYAAWFMEKNNIEVRHDLVHTLSYEEERYVARLENNDVIIADYAVIATGLHFFKNLPEKISENINRQYYSHTLDTVSFDFLKKKKCIIIGGRQSAFEWAALMLENGCNEVNILYDHGTPKFELSGWEWVDGLMENIAAKPNWFNSISAEERASISNRFWEEGRLKLEPWLAARLSGKNIQMWPFREIKKVTTVQDTIELQTNDDEKITGHHILLATGYKVDLEKVPFLVRGNMLTSIKLKKGFPVLNANFESSMRGLFFTGIATTQDFGPFFGFVKGAPLTATIIGKFIMSMQDNKRGI